MRTCRVLAGLLAVLCVAGLARAEKAKAEPASKKFRYLKMVHDGTAVPKKELKEFVLIVTGDKGVVKKGDQVIFEGTAKTDMNKTPWTIDVTTTAGKDKGQVMKGIWKVDKDKMTVCWGKPGGERPTEFKSEKGSGTILEVLQEIK